MRTLAGAEMAWASPHLSAQRQGWPAARCRAGSEATARQRAVGPRLLLGDSLVWGQ